MIRLGIKTRKNGEKTGTPTVSQKMLGVVCVFSKQNPENPGHPLFCKKVLSEVRKIVDSHEAAAPRRKVSIVFRKPGTLPCSIGKRYGRLHKY
jgi:hypothetical protein